jgi:hypothetical protein
MMEGLRKTEAKKILDEEVARLGVALTAFEVRDGSRPGANDLAWWHEHTPTAERVDTRYNLAHLRAYVRIAGGEVLPAVGIPLNRQRLWMDRSTISRLEREGYLEFKRALYSTFILTDKGRTWVAQGNPEF